MTAPRLFAMVIALAPGVASGQATSALRGHNTNAPVDFDAARIEVSQNQNQVLLSGAVRIRQADLRLDADKVRIAYTQPKTGDLIMRRLDAEGAVRLESPSERASGRFGIYDVSNRQITLVGDVVLTRGDSVLKGQRLAIDLASGRSTLDGGAARPAPGVPESGANTGRVSGRFAVPQRAPATPAR